MKIHKFQYLMFVVGGLFVLSVSAHEFEEMANDAAEATESLKNKSCKKATTAQIEKVKLGNTKLEKFLAACKNAKISDELCNQLTRPNPDSANRFVCTYGSALPHQLIDPDESTWKYAFEGAQLVQRLKKQGFCVNEIYNWWRPEPYNANVGGAPGRHPFGTSVDVAMCNMKDTNKAFKKLCEWREDGDLNAIGYYGNTGLHFGVGDALENTWGKSCGNNGS